MTKREKILGLAFGALFVVLVGGFGGMAAFRKIGSMRAESDQLAERERALQSVIETRAMWEQRSGWISENAPTFSTDGKASAELIGHVDQVSTRAGVTVESKELVNENPDDEEFAEGGFFESAKLKVRVSGNEQSVVTWIHSLQQPTKFTGVSGVILEDGESGLNCEAEVRLWYSVADE